MTSFESVRWAYVPPYTLPFRYFRHSSVSALSTETLLETALACLVA